MAVKNTLKDGIDWIDGDILFAVDLNDTNNTFFTKSYSDNTGGSVTNTTTETTLATVTVLTADFNSGSTNVSFIIDSGVEAFNNDATGRVCTFRIKVGGVTVKTITSDSLSTASSNPISQSFSINNLDTGNDLSSSNVIVIVTAQWSTASANAVAKVEGLAVNAARNN